MVDQFKYPEYKPYPTLLPEPVSGGVLDYAPEIEELIQRLTDLIDSLSSEIDKLRQQAASQAVIITGRDLSVLEALNGVWDEGTEIPLLIYDVTKGSANTKHQFIADTALIADRGVSGDYVLDSMDILSAARREAERFLLWLKSAGRKDMFGESIVDSLEATLSFYLAVDNYRTLNKSWFKSSKESDEIKNALGVQKESHEYLSKINSTISAEKRVWNELERTGQSFYGDTLSKLNTSYQADISKSDSLVFQRSVLIGEASRGVFQAISAGKSLKNTWKEASSISLLEAKDVAYQAYVSHNPNNLSSATKALESFKSEQTHSFMDSAQIFVRKENYTEEDVEAIVSMLNSLPENHTFIDAGIISVRSAYTFVEELLSQINEMPAGSTLISGGMIALTGKTLDEFQEQVESGEYGASVQQVIDALNESAGGMSGLTILLPGVIGLTGDDDIREAIVEALNTIGENSTLIGPGSILISGDKTLEEKFYEWETSIADAEQRYYEQRDLLSFFGITDTTLIDGAKISTGGVLVDYLLSGMTEIKNGSIDIALYNYETITISSTQSYRIREMRSYDSPNNWYTWPEACGADTGSFKYKIQISTDETPDWNTAPYIRGTSSAWDDYYRLTYVDNSGSVKDTPLVFVLEGNYARHIRIHFGGFYDSASPIPDQEDYHLATEYQIFGASAWIDGGHIMAQSIQVGSFDEEVTEILTNAEETYSNFNTRNDRNSVTPVDPTLGGSPISHTLNNDGTANLLFQWSF